VKEGVEAANHTEAIIRDAARTNPLGVGGEDIKPAQSAQLGRPLAAGEVGYRLSMKKILSKFHSSGGAASGASSGSTAGATSASAAAGDILFIADDDVRFHHQFEQMYSSLDSYCFDGLASGAGLLKLSSSIWHKVGIAIYNLA
jgi:hypothetical protein